MPKKLKGELGTIRRALRGAPFPAAKSDIVEYARNNGASDGTLSVLQGLSKNSYEREADIIAEIGESG